MFSLKYIIISLLGSTLGCYALTYTTSFPATENPISESSNWTNGATVGLDWHNCQTIAGKAFGTQVSGDTDGTDDSTAVLAGSWGVNQTVQATVFVLSTGSSTEEVELRVNTLIAPHSITGYEINFSCHTSTKYVEIVRWNGAHANFTILSQDNTHSVVDGDIVKATIDGSGHIAAFINGVQIITATDTTYTTGQPGMGFFLENSVTASNYGFTQFSATDGITPAAAFNPAPFGR